MEKNRQHLETVREKLIEEIRRRSNRKEGTEDLNVKLHRLDGARDILTQLSAKYTLVDRTLFLKMTQWVQDAAQVLSQCVEKE
jgi:hypothetical protein